MLCRHGISQRYNVLYMLCDDLRKIFPETQLVTFALNFRTQIRSHPNKEAKAAILSADEFSTVRSQAINLKKIYNYQRIYGTEFI